MGHVSMTASSHNKDSKNKEKVELRFDMIVERHMNNKEKSE